MRPNFTPPEEPKDAAGYNRRGNQYSRNGAYEQAIADYTQALELDDALADAWFNRGVSFYELGMYDESIADLTQAIEIEPRTTTSMAAAPWPTCSATGWKRQRRTRTGAMS